MDKQEIDVQLVGMDVSIRLATPGEVAAHGPQVYDERRAARQFVRHALNIGALELVPAGRKLKSGRMSPYFFNAGLFCTARDLEILGEAYVDVIAEHVSDTSGLPDVVFGPAYKGIEIAAAVAMALRWNWDDCNPGVAYNRKEAKDHGEGGVLVGASLRDRNVLITDDVITSGQSKREAVELIRGAGGNPTGCVIAFDRQERGEHSEYSAAQEFALMYHIPVYPAATLDDLILELETGSAVPGGEEALLKIHAYRDQYGVK